MSKSFQTLALLLATTSLYTIIHSESDINSDILGTSEIDIAQINENDKEKTHQELLALVSKCAHLLEYKPGTIEYISGTYGNVLNHYLALIKQDLDQQLPDTYEAGKLIEQEFVIRLYKCLYNSICAGKQANDIAAPPAMLFMVPTPDKFKKEVNNSFVRMYAIENGLIEPMKPWFPSEAKRKIEQLVQGLTEQEQVIILYGYYMITYELYPVIEDTRDYETLYSELCEKLAKLNYPSEESALFNQLYTPMTYECISQSVQQQ